MRRRGLTHLLPVALLACLLAGCASPLDAVRGWFEHSEKTIAEGVEAERRAVVADMIDARLAMRAAEAEGRITDADALRQTVRELEAMVAELRDMDLEPLKLKWTEVRRVRVTPDDSPDEVVDVHVRVSGNTLKRRPDGGFGLVPLPDYLGEWVFVCRHEKDGWQLVVPPTTPAIIDRARQRQQEKFRREAAVREAGPTAADHGMATPQSIRWAHRQMLGAIGEFNKMLVLAISEMRLDQPSGPDGGSAPDSGSR